MRDWRIVAGVAATTGVAIGLALASMLGGDARQGMPAGAAVTPPANSKVPAGRDSEWASLRDELAHEREARLLLVEEIDLLWEELELIAQNAEPAAPIADPTVPDDNASKQTEARRQFDDSRLAKAGLETDEIERLRENYEAMELDELYLRDQAAREGWLNGGRYRRELRDLKEQLREDLGEEDYDRMLFATGQKNRVRVKGVIGHSPAADAGLLAGDLILRYANKRVFNPRALRTWTTRGTSGETVWIEVLRNGEIISVAVPRGPLGVKIEGESLSP
jgi:hypothetical protein